MDAAMPTITQNVTVLHQLQKTTAPVSIELSAGQQVSIIKEWASHYLIRLADGKVFNVGKAFVDPGT
jgi:hypothetical protein